MDRVDILRTVRGELESLLNAPVDFADTDRVADHGLDSLASVQLTLNLEDTFGVVFEDDEITVENFATIERMVELIQVKLAGDRV